MPVISASCKAMAAFLTYIKLIKPIQAFFLCFSSEGLRKAAISLSQAICIPGRNAPQKLRCNDTTDCDQLLETLKGSIGFTGKLCKVEDREDCGTDYFFTTL